MTERCIIATLRLGLLLILTSSATPALAETSCDSLVDHIRLSTDGSIELYFLSSAPIKLLSGNAGREQIVAAAMSALIARRAVTVTYGTDNAGCTANSAFRGDATSVILK